MARVTTGALLGAAALLLAACGGGAASSTPTTIPVTAPAAGAPSESTAAPAPTAPPSTAASPTVATTSLAPDGTATGQGATNLAVTDALRAELVAAASQGAKAGFYTGLVPGTTYYAYDGATGTYWVGAGLVPSPTSLAAQVSTQDDGSYLIFARGSSPPWQIFTVGLSGVARERCSVPIPADVLQVWGWAAGTCRPPG